MKYWNSLLVKGAAAATEWIGTVPREAGGWSSGKDLALWMDVPELLRRRRVPRTPSSTLRNEVGERLRGGAGDALRCTIDARQFNGSAADRRELAEAETTTSSRDTLGKLLVGDVD